MRLVWWLDRLSPSAWMALAMLTVILALTLIVPQLPSSDPYAQEISMGSRPPLFTDPEGKTYVLGTDALGRDVLSRLALAGRVSLLIAGAAVLVSLVVGTALGLVAGYAGGVWDSVISGTTDVQLSLPRFLLLISVIALFGPTIVNITLMIGLTGWVTYARLARAQTMSLREREFVLAAKAVGCRPSRILYGHVLPNAIGAAVILASFDLGQVIMLEASLSFVGIGVQPPLPAWGSMVREGEVHLRTAPHLMVIPGMIIFFVVSGVNQLTQQFTSERVGTQRQDWARRGPRGPKGPLTQKMEGPTGG